MGWVYACSLSFGYQKNLATDILIDGYGMPIIDSDGAYKLKGFIPSIKVFSLSGIDNVRGFTPNEINKLDTGQNIGEVIVKDKAFFSNLKFEPRYYFNEQFAFSFFLDGGRLYVGEFNPVTMRFGAGIGLKLLTPVGSLDFDYGVKLKRKTFSSSQREEFGRFHLSIGFF
jgi:outer membrane protein insertion porin family